MNSVPHRHRFNVTEYYRATAEFPPELRTELMDGEIIDMVPPGNRHAACVSRLNRLLTLGFGQRAIVRLQDPLRLSDFFEPQPDVVVLRDRADFYEEAHPGAGDCLLVIEVSSSSYTYDRNTKVPVYARHGVPQMWLVDLEREQVEVYREPAAGEYRERIVARPGSVLNLGELQIPVAAIFGR